MKRAYFNKVILNPYSDSIVTYTFGEICSVVRVKQKLCLASVD